MYQNGKGVAQDDTKAVQWYTKAAEAGNASGMTSLGWMYANGRGIAKDDAKAVQWYTKAAEAGEATGMRLLGWMYANGRGIAKDDAKAVQWYTKGSNNGMEVSAGDVVAAPLAVATAIVLGGDAGRALGNMIKTGMDKLLPNVRTRFGQSVKQDSQGAAQVLLQAYQQQPANSERAQFYKAQLEELLNSGQLKDEKVRQQIQNVFKPAPRLTWSTQPNRNTDAETVELVVGLQDSGSGIGNVRLLVNGIAVDQSSRALGRTQQGQTASTAANSTEQRFSLKLPKGSHQIRIEAFNAENLGVPATLDTTIVSNYQAVRQPKLHALVIGIDQYKNSTLQLNYAVSDANAIYQRLQQQVGGLYQAGQITRLTTPAQTTKANIIAELKKLQQQAHLEDVFVLYVASHGVSYDDTGYFMLTSDVLQTSQERITQHSLSSEELQDLIVKIGTNKKLVILDTCNSGRALNAERLLASRGMQDQTMVERMRRKAGATVLMASEATEQAREGYQGHGLFTYSVLQALTKGDMDKDGYVDSVEIIKHIQEQVPALAAEHFKTTQAPFTSFAGQSVVLKAQ